MTFEELRKAELVWVRVTPDKTGEKTWDPRPVMNKNEPVDDVVLCKAHEGLSFVYLTPIDKYRGRFHRLMHPWFVSFGDPELDYIRPVTEQQAKKAQPELGICRCNIHDMVFFGGGHEPDCPERSV